MERRRAEPDLLKLARIAVECVCGRQEAMKEMLTRSIKHELTNRWKTTAIEIGRKITQLGRDGGKASGRQVAGRDANLSRVGNQNKQRLVERIFCQRPF